MSIFLFKHHILALVICSLSMSVGAQVITVSDDLNLRTEFRYDVLGKVGDFLLVLRDGINEFDIQAYDEDMFMAWDVEKELDSRRSRLVDVVAHDHSFNIIYTVDNKDTITIKSRAYDSKVKLLHEDTLKVVKRGLIRPKFRFTKSEDQNIFLMTEVENEKIKSAFAYDMKSQTVLWDAAFEFDQKINFREEYRKTIIGNDGRMFLIFERNNVRHKKEQHSMEVFRYEPSINTFARASIPLPDFITFDALFVYDNENEHLVLVGLYSDRKFGSTDGLYHIILDGTNFTKWEMSTIDYEEELIADFHGKNSPKDEGLRNLDLQDVILRQDGGILLLAEENKEFERLSYGSRRDYYGSSRFSVDYYYEDIILISIHPDGTSHWQKLLPKRQYSNDDQAAYSSYFLFRNPSYLRILYNDEIRNENTVSEYILNGTGDITRRSLMSTDHQKLKLQIKNAVQTSNNELVIPSIRGKRLRLVRLTY